MELVSGRRCVGMLFAGALAVFAAMAMAGASAQDRIPADGMALGFAYRIRTGELTSYPEREVGDQPNYKIEDQHVRAEIRRIEGSVWELDLTIKSALVVEVWFPWEEHERFCGPSAGDDIILYPYRLGVAEKADAVQSGQWWGRLYPGGAHAPLVVMTDDYYARIVAAWNWPPYAVEPVYTRGRLALRYSDVPGQAERRTYRALSASVQGNALLGDYPWHHALDLYKSWLLEQMRRESLYPIDYPKPLRAAHGWQSVWLHWIARFDVDGLRSVYQRNARIFPWIQFWGQMSNYQQSPGDGLTAQPVPPLEAGEQTGCCLTRMEMHRRYLPELPAFAREVASGGGIVGYYQRPREPYARLDAGDGKYAAFLTEWIARTGEDGANAYYLDVVGAHYFGDPLKIARMIQSTFPPMTVIEFPVDLYPTAFLVSGSLWGNVGWETDPGITPRDFGPRRTRATFPRLGRYLLDDRIMFLGVSNGDFMWWGDVRGHQHWTERQAFLLGAKLDAPTLFKGVPGWYDPINPAVEEIVGEWERTNWWKRNPAYRDRSGISRCSPAIDVRRFVDQDGLTLFVVENWGRRPRQTFDYGGRTIQVPERRFCIMELPRHLELEGGARE